MADQNLLEIYNKTGDPAYRDKLVIEHLGLVKYLAGRLAVSAPPVMSQEDLEGYGVIGLLDAIEKFNDKLGTEFKNYAYTRVRGAMLDEIRKQSWVPRSKWQKLSQLNNAREKLWQQGKKTSDKVLASEMGVDGARLRQLAAEYYNAFPVSLDETTGFDNENALADMIRDPDSPDPLDVITEQDEMESLVEAIKGLPERDRLVLALYYQEELTLKEIGLILEVTESRVCQLHTKVLQRLREKLARDSINYKTRRKGMRI